METTNKRKGREREREKVERERERERREKENSQCDVGTDSEKRNFQRWKRNFQRFKRRRRRQATRRSTLPLAPPAWPARAAAMDKYESEGVAGEGSYGVVLKCRQKDTGRSVGSGWGESKTHGTCATTQPISLARIWVALRCLLSIVTPALPF